MRRFCSMFLGTSPSVGEQKTTFWGLRNLGFMRVTTIYPQNPQNPQQKNTGRTKPPYPLTG